MIAPFTETARAVYGDPYAVSRHLAAMRDVVSDLSPNWWHVLNNEETAYVALEAAARVESGEWP